MVLRRLGILSGFRASAGAVAGATGEHEAATPRTLTVATLPRVERAIP